MKRECNQDGGAEELWEENFRMFISGAQITGPTLASAEQPESPDRRGLQGN